MPQTRLVPRSKTRYINKILSTFGSSLIGYWPLNERSGAVAYDLSGNNRHGSYTGVDLAQAGIGDRQSAPYFDGVNDYVNIYSTSLRDAFNGLEGSLLQWFKVAAAGVWTDSTTRYSFYLAADANNYVRLSKSTTNSRMVAIYRANSISKTINIDAQTSLGWICYAITWSKSNDRIRAYVNGLQSGIDQTGIPDWSGSLASSWGLLGASTKAPVTVMSGWLAHAFILNREATPAEMLKAGTL